MDTGSNQAFAQVLFSITSAGLPVVLTTEPEQAQIGDVRFTVKLPKELAGQIRNCRAEFLSRLTANFLGEWFVKANIGVFEHHICSNIPPCGFGVSVHKNFGMMINGETLAFAFHASLLHSMSGQKPKTPPAPGKGWKAPTGNEAAPVPGGADGGSVPFRKWLAGIPLLRPRQMFDRLAAEGYVGQDAARTAVCLMAYRHVRRLRMIHIDGVPRNSLPIKENVLLLGPTGCGKTYLVELLFSRILGLPTILADMTSFTETGYIGDSVSGLFPRLVQAAGGDVLKASVGIICLDEFDKLAACGSRARFAGQGTTKDVSGYGVQRELLKLLESVDVQTEEGADGSKAPARTSDIPFIACGAFSGFKAAVRSLQKGAGIGFGAIPGDSASRRVVTESVKDEEVIPVANFAEYGMLPELMGRFSRIIPLQPMGMQELLKILTTQVIVRYQRELESSGVQLEIETPTLQRIAAECLRMETGARGIVASLAAHLENACFNVYSLPSPAGSVIRVRCDGGRVLTEVMGSGDRSGQALEMTA